nr:DUF1636 family protein [Azorhizobium doebereinerae]
MPLQPLDSAGPLDEPAAAPPEAVGEAATLVTLFVCTTCKTAGAEAGTPPAGQQLYAAARAAGDGSVAVREVQCLANCKRGLSAALVRAGGWSYVFGDLTPESAGDLLAGGRLFRDAADGLMPWRGRPDALKRGMIARIPPLSLPPSA